MQDAIGQAITNVRERCLPTYTLCWIGLHRWASVFTHRGAPHVCSRCWDVMRNERGVYTSLKEDHVSQVIRRNAKDTHGKRS